MITAELKKRARQTNLVEYLRSKGINPIHEYGDEYHHPEHDSLKLKNNMFVWNSQSQSGNAIDYCMAVEGMTFQEAVAALTGENHAAAPPTPKEDRGKERAVFGYLCKTRGLDYKLIAEFVRAGLIRQDDRLNCVFVVKDWNGREVASELKGTRMMDNGEYFQKVVGKRDGFRFHKQYGLTVEDIYIFEATIDLLSYIELHPDRLNNALFVSMGGLTPSVLRSLRSQFPNVQAYHFCVDNDDAGRKFIEDNRDSVPQCFAEMPQFDKDWNDALRNQKDGGAGKKS